MRIRSGAFVNSLTAVATLLLLLLVGAMRAHATEANGCPRPPHSPADLEEELYRVLHDRPLRCPHNWYINNDPTFGSWDGGGGSLNLPVVTAAVGLYLKPHGEMQWLVKPRRNPNPNNYKITHVNWWIWFLASQTGQNPRDYLPPNFVAPPARSNLRYFKGTEQFSNIYEASVVTSVVAVRYWAHLHGNTQLMELTRRYLRANWAVYGMAAGRGPVWRYELPGRTPVAPHAKPALHTQYDPAAPRRPDGRYIYNGTFLALAGARSTLGGHWNYDYKALLYDRAMNSLGALVIRNMPVEQLVLDTLESKWAGLASRPAAENLYGLTQDDRDRLNALRQTGTNVSHFMPWLAGIRISTPYRIIGWNGWRVSSMKSNTNGNTPNMYGIAYQADDPNDPDPSHAKATFLFPWRDRGGAGTAGLCTLEPGVMRARHDGTPKHPAMEVVMTGLPTERPQFHVVLSSNSEPYLEDEPPGSWPPEEPKVFDATPPPIATPPGTAFGGDTAWVANSLPAGATPGGENELWTWVDEDPAPDSDSIYVHQSAALAGRHQHFFTGATETLTVGAGELLYANVYLDPSNPPRQVMLQWNDGTWEHRAYWGENLIPWGDNGTTSRHYVGPLPPAGVWARLEVPAGAVGLEGRTLNGMAFTLYDGRATWDEAGKSEPVFQLANLSAGKPAAQSSTIYNSSAQRAADGNTDGNYYAGSVSHTDFHAQAWWQVDLGAVHHLEQINVWNRTDCCSERLSNFYVFVSDEPFASTDLNATLNQPGVWSYLFARNGERPTAIGVGRAGRHVRVQLAGSNYLSLAEVEVLGVPNSSPSTPTLAVGDASVVEGSAGSASAVFAVSLSAPSANAVQVNYATADGSAVANSDYTPSGGSLTFSPGETTKTVSILVVGDTAAESDEAFYVNLTGPTNAHILDGQGQGTIVNDDSTPPAPSSGEAVWVEDALPPGASPGGDEPWHWTNASNSPRPFSGSAAHQSGLATEIHQHYFTGATGANALVAGAGDRLFAYVYLDPSNPPSEIMLQWNDGTWWDHRAYWGANLIGYGTDGTESRRYMGPLPPAGRWVRLEVPASLVGAENVPLSGMAFTLYGGAATWDYAGKVTNDTVWVEDGIPAGATPVHDPEGWNWVENSDPAPFSGRAAHQSALLAGPHQHYFVGASNALSVGAGNKLFTYVHLDPSNPPSEVMLQWDDGSGAWAHRAYWGANLLPYGDSGTASRYYMGPLPPAGRWVRLEVPASAVGLQGVTVRGMAFTLYGGRATWDRAGKSP